MSKVIVFIEDPGAANFVLEKKIWSLKEFKIYSVEPAYSYLKKRNIKSIFLNNKINIEDLFNKEVKFFLTGTSENKYSLSFKLIEICRKMNVKTISVVDSPAALDKRFKGTKKDNFYYLTDYIAVSHVNIKKELINLGICKDKIKFIKHPYYVEVEKYLKRLPSLNKENKIKKIFGKKIFNQRKNNKKIIVFLSEISDGLKKDDFIKNEEYTLTGNEETKFRTDVVLDEIFFTLDKLKNDFIFTIKLHPKDDKKNYEKYSNKISKFLKNQNPLEVVFFADYVIGMTTNLLIEAAILQKEVLSIIPRKKERNWLPDAIQPSIKCIYSKKSMLRIFNNFFSGKLKRDYIRKDLKYPELVEMINKLK